MFSEKFVLIISVVVVVVVSLLTGILLTGDSSFTGVYRASIEKVNITSAGDKEVIVITLKNTGTQPLKIRNVLVNNETANYTVDRPEIKPLEETSIKIIVSPEKMGGAEKIWVRIEFDCGEYCVLEINRQ